MIWPLRWVKSDKLDESVGCLKSDTYRFCKLLHSERDWSKAQFGLLNSSCVKSACSMFWGNAFLWSYCDHCQLTLTSIHLSTSLKDGLVNRSWQATEQQCQQAKCKPKRDLDETLIQIMSTCRPICSCSARIGRTKAARYSTPKWKHIYMTMLKETPETNHLRLKLNLQDELQSFSCFCNWPKSSCGSTENRDCK